MRGGSSTGTGRRGEGEGGPGELIMLKTEETLTHKHTQRLITLAA